MKIKNIGGKLIAILILAVTLLLMNRFSYIAENYGYSADAEEIRLNDGWTVTVNESTYRDVDLQNFSFPVVGKGDSLSMTTTLPTGLEKATTLRLLTYLSVVNVYIDDSQIYEYGQEKQEKGRMVGSGYHFIELPPDAAGKTIIIEMNPTEEDAFTSITPPRVVETSSAYQIFLEENKLSLSIGVFLFVLGFLLTAISCVAALFNKEYARLVWIGLFSFLLGVWTLCNTKVFQLFSTELSLNAQIEYLTLYLAPTPFCMILLETRKQIALWRKKVIMGCTIAVFGFSCVTFLLHITDTVHYPATVTAFHVIAAVGMLVCIVLTLHNWRKMRLSDLVMYAGIAVLSVFVAADLVRFNLQKYVISASEKLTTSCLPIGTLLFVLFMIVSYIIYLYDRVLSKAEEESLQRIAYCDALTGLYNRTKCEELFAELDGSEEDFGLISFDMNGLKKRNDTYGHAEGDKMLISFAKSLKEVFGKHADVIRMGGDEFLVLIRQAELGRMEDLLGKFQKQMEAERSDPSEPLAAAYGACKRSECEEKNAEKVYIQADARMYKMKHAEN